MSTQVIRCVKTASLPIQNRLFTLRTAPWATTFLPRFGILPFHWVEPSRLLSSTGEFSKVTRDISDRLKDRGVLDVGKWNHLMDELAERSKTDLVAIEEWAYHFSEGVAAGLPGIEATLIRHKELSPNLATYMNKVLAVNEEDKDLTVEEGGLRIKEKEEECKLEEVAREELASELEREQGSSYSGRKRRNRKF